MAPVLTYRHSDGDNSSLKVFSNDYLVLHETATKPLRDLAVESPRLTIEEKSVPKKTIVFTRNR